MPAVDGVSARGWCVKSTARRIDHLTGKTAFVLLHSGGYRNTGFTLYRFEIHQRRRLAGAVGIGPNSQSPLVAVERDILVGDKRRSSRNLVRIFAIRNGP